MRKQRWDTGSSFPESLNCGVSGSLMDHAKRFAPRLVQKYRPSVVVLVAGENDLADGAPPSKVFESFKQTFSAITSVAPLIYISTKPEPCTRELEGEYKELNRLIAQHYASKAGRSGDGGTYIDVYDSMSIGGKGKEPNPALFDDDGLHLSAEGYALWEGFVRQAIKSLRDQS